MEKFVFFQMSNDSNDTRVATMYNSQSPDNKIMLNRVLVIDNYSNELDLC